MWNKLLVDIILSLLTKLGAFIIKSIKQAREIARIKKKQKAKEEAIENAKTPNDIRTSHRNNKL